MRTFAQKQNQPQERASSSLVRSNKSISGPIHHTYPILHPQRTLGNQAVQRLLKTDADKLDVDSTSTAATTRFAHDFSQIPMYAKTLLKIQPKLTVNTPGDVYEQEANQAAEQVMRMPEPRQQLTCPCGGGCPKCQGGHGDHEALQTKAVRATNSGGAEASPIVHEALRSHGQQMDSATREFMESRFGHDFSMVRVHAGSEASDSARAVRARAYTAGRDIVFGTGEYAPTTLEGKKLLAHELTHVLQQAEGIGPTASWAAAPSPVVQRQASESGLPVELPESDIPAEPTEPVQLGSISLDLDPELYNGHYTVEFTIPVTRAHALVTFQGTARTNYSPQGCRTVTLYLLRGDTNIASQTFWLNGRAQTQDFYPREPIQSGQYRFLIDTSGDWCRVGNPRISVRW